MSPVQLNLSNEPPCSRARVVALVQRLTSDAHNETGSARAYAQALLADLGLPMPADPEKREPAKPADPFVSAPRPARASIDFEAAAAPQFVARYDGTCSTEYGCGGTIEAGTMIRSDGDGGYLCEDCAND